MRPARLLRCASLALVAALAAARAAAAGPEWRVAVGGTAAALGGVNEGGVSVGVSALWPVEERFAFGAMLTADDLGSQPRRLADPNDGTDLGASEGLHRAAWGAAWRMDARAATAGPWTPWASGTWGYSYLRDDVRGTTTGRLGSTGFSLAAGVSRALRGGVTLAGVARYHRLFNDRAGRYVSAGVEWAWR